MASLYLLLWTAFESYLKSLNFYLLCPLSECDKNPDIDAWTCEFCNLLNEETTKKGTTESFFILQIKYRVRHSSVKLVEGVGGAERHLSQKCNIVTEKHKRLCQET